MGKNRSGKASKAAKTSQTSSLAAQFTTSGVRDDPTLGFKIRALLHDLSNLAKDPAAARRLNNTTDEHYISGPYFSTEEAKAVKEAIVDVDFDGTRNPNANYEAEYTNDVEDGNEEDAGTSRSVSRVQGKTVDTAIRMLMDNFLEKRKASGDARPCGPHDIAPVYLGLFGITKSELHDQKFLSRLSRSGL